MTENPTQTNEKQHIKDNVYELLTDTQWRFITAMIENPTFTKKDAAEYIDIDPNTVYGWSSKAPYVDKALDTARRDIHSAAMAMRQQALLKALRVKVKLLDSEDESIKSRVASELIEWELGKATQRSELTGKDGGPVEWSQVMSVDPDDIDDPFA